MNSIASTYEDHADPFDGPITWVFETFKLAVAIWAAGMLFGGMIYYAVSPMLTAIHLGPVTGYWNCVLVALGLYGLFMLWEAATRRRFYNPLRTLYDDERTAEFWDTVTEPGVLLLVAWLIATYLA